jgi:hypothetical protein
MGAFIVRPYLPMFKWRLAALGRCSGVLCRKTGYNEFLGLGTSMMPYSFIRLEPLAWTQSLHSERGARFSVNARVSTEYNSFLISGVGDVGSLHTELTFVRGAHDWQIPEGPPASLGFLAYHPADQYSDVAFMGGGCSTKEDIFDDAWHRIKNSTYDACSISLEVAPIDYDGEDPLWNREKNKFLYIQQLELSFVRKEKVREEAPTPKRGLFG